ncbi:Two-component transcriptional response regulator, LuxR family [Cupriavidus sp. U2]|uniref:helix-turn-helix transcriptional regulator n=1 Tax=Cupriavidus sp. U2 TaxID=2920269 RepID=UPI00129DF073|nr:LuxR C-terminal-related transcriptional regulator [Cupriavidus sp. U2]KAI3593562.1 Two-component transcriptional response regulator, LuxR family [Cupriavidus sp. U2]
MKAAVVESRPLIGFGIQQVLYRIQDIDDSCLMSPGPVRGLTLDGIELLIVGDLLQGYDAAMLDLLRTATDVRAVLYLSAGGTVQWMPPRDIPPLLSWLPENASLEAIEGTLRKMIGAMRRGCCTGTPYAHALPGDGVTPPAAARDAAIVLPMSVQARLSDTRLPEFVTEAQLLSLTQRQYDVLVLLSKGMSIKLISRRLHISVPTVKSHTLQIYRRLAASNKTEAVFVARERGALLTSISAAAEAA